MSVLDQIYLRAKENPRKVAFPEAMNEKMMQAAYETGKEGYIIPVLVGNGSEIREAARERGYEESVFTIVDISEEEYKKTLIDKYVALPQTILKEKALNRRMQNPLYYAMVMQAVEEADVTFAGIDNTTGDVLFRYSVRRVLRLFRRKGYNQKHVLLVGCSRAAFFCDLVKNTGKVGNW